MKLAAFTTAQIETFLEIAKARAAKSVQPGFGYYQEDVERDDAKAVTFLAELELRKRAA